MDPVHPGGVLDLLHRVEAAGGASAGNVLKGGGEQRQELFRLVRLRKEFYEDKRISNMKLNMLIYLNHLKNRN